MSKGLINIILFFAGCIVLYIIAGQLIAEKKVPSLGDALASSTAQLASSTAQLASSTSAILNSISSSTTRTAFDFPSTSLFTSKGSVKVFLANNDVDREQGLSDITSLPKGVGVLFVFDTPGSYGFWMKDMHFPLDLIWIGADKKIVGVTRNVLPSSYPSVFMPPSDILYALEMNAGSVSSFGLTTGTEVKF